MTDIMKLHDAAVAAAIEVAVLKEEGVFLGNIYEITRELELIHGIGGTQ